MITTCPKMWCGGETFEFLTFAELYRRGIPPVPGGSLDQTAWFNEASRVTWAEESYWKAKLGVLDSD